MKTKHPSPKVKTAKRADFKPELKTEKEIAMDFAVKVHQRFDRLIKSSVLFGSQVRGESTVDSDIDIIFIIDDASINWDMELVSWYREELSKLVSADSHGKDIHINSIRLTSWWRDVMYGDPVVINILRYGEALIDSGGFFNPIKALLIQGKIHSTPEAVYSALQRSPAHLARSRSAELGAIEGVYWSMVDAAQAALMMAGKVPPSPEHLPEMLSETFVSKGVLDISYVRALKEIYVLHKSISHGQVTNIKGAEIDKWQDTAEKFLSQSTKIIDSLIDVNKI